MKRKMHFWITIGGAFEFEQLLVALMGCNWPLNVAAAEGCSPELGILNRRVKNNENTITRIINLYIFFNLYFCLLEILVRLAKAATFKDIVK